MVRKWLKKWGVPIVVIAGVVALGYKTRINEEDRRLLEEKASLLQQAYAICNGDDYNIPEVNELRRLGIKLNVVGDNEILPPNELEKRIESAPYDSLKKFVKENQEEK